MMHECHNVSWNTHSISVTLQPLLHTLKIHSVFINAPSLLLNYFAEILAKMIELDRYSLLVDLVFKQQGFY